MLTGNVQGFVIIPDFSTTSLRRRIVYVRLRVWRSEPGDNYRSLKAFKILKESEKSGLTVGQ